MGEVQGMTPEVFREFGLTPPGEIPRDELDRMWARITTMVEAMVTPGLGWEEEDRRNIGRVYHPFVEGTTDWVKPHLKLAQFLTALKLDDETYFAKRVWEAVGPTAVREYALSMALWYENNFPKVVLDPTYAAGLMSTKLSPEVADLIIPPWKGFMIELTDTPLTLITKQGKEVPLKHIFVNMRQGGFTMLGLAGQWDVMFLGTSTTADLVKDDAEKVEKFLEDHRNALDDISQSKLFVEVQDARTSLLSARARVDTVADAARVQVEKAKAAVAKAATPEQRARLQAMEGELESTLAQRQELQDKADVIQARLGVLQQEGADIDKGLATLFMQANSRLLPLVQRLVAGTCLAMSDPSNVRQRRPQAQKKHTLYKARRGLPLVRVFDVGRPIKVDCRATVTDFLRGRRATVQNVQILVRGHWKSQAHGPKHSLRKAIHIEPYWRGPEDAPIPIRSHTLGTP